MGDWGLRIALGAMNAGLIVLLVCKLEAGRPQKPKYKPPAKPECHCMDTRPKKWPEFNGWKTKYAKGDTNDESSS